MTLACMHALLIECNMFNPYSKNASHACIYNEALKNIALHTRMYIDVTLSCMHVLFMLHNALRSRT